MIELLSEFGIGIGDYEGVVRIPRRVFQRLIDQAPTPERCLELYHLQRTRLELIAEQAAPPPVDRRSGCRDYRARPPGA